MGNAQTKLYTKLTSALPNIYDGPHNGWFDESEKPFPCSQDRDQFIYGIITVMTNNGQLDLQDHNFRLLYSRRENDRVVARIVARKEGVIEAKVEPDADGKDQPEAFRALRKHVEVKLEHILQNVPGEGSATQGVADSRGMPADAPPAYGTGDPVKGLVK